jgi:glycosyltransferase involved in cell wall biosynthesis
MHNTIYEGYMDAIERYKKLNDVFIAFGQDDLIFDLPAKNPFSKTVYKDAKKRLRRCLKAADRLVVTTAPLADALRGMAEDIRVVPNYLDEEIWGGLVSQRAVADKPRVGWAGALQHGGDLELLTEVVRQTADEVDWVFFGMCPAALRPYVKESHNPIEFARYPEKLASLNLDLAVAPLEHNRFNECKSNLRLLEYGVLGWPVVASDIAPYRDAPVCRVPNQPRAWINAIRERIHNLDAARREGDELRSWVRGNWMLQQHLGEWLAALVPGSEFEQNYRAQNTAIG